MSNPTPGQIIAAALRDDAKEVWQGRGGPWLSKLTCSSCGRASLHMEDNRCPECNGQWDEGAYIERRAKAVRLLWEQTARLMDRMGEPAEAEKWRGL